MNEAFAAAILQAAITEGRAAELLLALFDGAACTLGPDGLVILPSVGVEELTRPS